MMLLCFTMFYGQNNALFIFHLIQLWIQSHLCYIAYLEKLYIIADCKYAFNQSLFNYSINVFYTGDLILTRNNLKIMKQIKKKNNHLLVDCKPTS